MSSLADARARGRHAKKPLPFGHLTKQRLINERADGINKRHCWYDRPHQTTAQNFSIAPKKPEACSAPFHGLTALQCVQRSPYHVRRHGVGRSPGERRGLVRRACLPGATDALPGRMVWLLTVVTGNLSLSAWSRIAYRLRH